MNTLPSPRGLLSEIVQQLATAALRSEETASTSIGVGGGDVARHGAIGAGGAILASLDEPHRQLLLSLHCLLPSTLLPALDLLDRGLVVRYRAASENQQLSDIAGNKKAEALGEHQGELSASPPEVSASPPNVHSSTQPPPPHRDVFYVTSIAGVGGLTKHHHGPGMNLTASRYEVCLHAWNCTCAGFVYASMHPSASTLSSDPFQKYLPEAAVATSGPDEEKTNGLLWGGSSYGKREETPPACKHLVACLLAEYCGGIFGKFVSTREVTRELLAEIAAVWE